MERRPDYWVQQKLSVREAVLRNALDASREDQWLWMERYWRMVEKGGELFAAAEAATPEVDDEEIALDS